MCGQERAQLMQTNVDNGDVIAVGNNCMVVFYLTAAAEMLSMMPVENRAAYATACADALVTLDGVASAGAAADALELDEDPTTGDMVPLAEAEHGNAS
jgi:hypothetical protein